MRFQVPQFIDIEDKIFGPFTFFQFGFLVGGGGIIFVLYKLLPLIIGIFFILPVAVLTACLVFVRINNKPFVYYLQASLNYLISSKLYVWKQRLVKKTDKKEDDDIQIPTTISNVPMLSENKLKDLSWSLDVQEKESN